MSAWGSPIASSSKYIRAFTIEPSTRDRKSTRLNSSHANISTLSLHDALPILSNLRANMTRATQPHNPRTPLVPILSGGSVIGLHDAIDARPFRLECQHGDLQLRLLQNTFVPSQSSLPQEIGRAHV